jgi:hypothetical protein
MDPYRLLLESIGVFDHGIPCDIKPPATPPLALMVNDSTFNSCVDSEFHLDYDQEISHYLNCKKKHRYSRKARFKSTLFQLIGVSGDTPSKIIKIVRNHLKPSVRRSSLWNQVRHALKQNNLSLFYNRIPLLIKLTIGLKPRGVTYDAVQKILNDFNFFHYQFNNHLAERWSRKYFPNLRFIALKLMQKHGITFPYKVPLVRTCRKKKYLEGLYAQF